MDDLHAYEDELTLMDLWELVRPAIIPVLIVAVIAGLLTFFILSRSPKVYEAGASVLVLESKASAGLSEVSDLVPPLDPEAYRQAAFSYPLLSQVGLTEKDEKKQLRIALNKGRRSSILSLKVKDHDPEWASELANRWADALLNWERQRVRSQLERQQEALRARLEVLDREIQQARVNRDTNRIGALQRIKADILKDLDWIRALIVAAEANTNLELLEAAYPPKKPVAPRPKLMAALVFILTFLLLIVAVIARQALDPRVRSSEEAARLANLPVLTEFPKLPPGIGRELSKEAANFLRVNVDRALIGESPKIVVVTSPEESEGKSSVSLALSRAYARSERRVLLIDADLRRPVLDEELRVSSDNGLVFYLENPFAEIQPKRISDYMDFIPAGETPDDPSGLLTEHWKHFLARVTELGRYDVVVIDSAPVLPVADTLIIVPHASGAILVVAEGRTWKRRLLAAKELLQRVGAKILGVAMTHVRQGVFWSNSQRYGYGYGYGYGRSKKDKDKKKEAELVGKS